jgi:hypothetical protein
MARFVRMDDEIVLTAARRLIAQGTYPTGREVSWALNGRWTDSAVNNAMGRLKVAGRLIIPPGLARGLDVAGINSPKVIAARAREVLSQRLGTPEPRRARTHAESMAADYWTPERRALYRTKGGPA